MREIVRRLIFMPKTAVKTRKTPKVMYACEAKKGTRKIIVDDNNPIEQSYIDIISRRKKAFDKLAD
jgi:hypothetical protein